MKYSNITIQSHNQSKSISAQARWLMSISRAQRQKRIQSMLHRAASEVGLNSL